MTEVVTTNLDLWTSALIGKVDGARGGNGRSEAHGIRKLRELILGSALRGLFEKDNKSLPVSIEQDIAKAKDAYFEAMGKKAKEYRFGPPLLDEFKLPAGWKWMRVGDLCDLQTGATPSTHKPEYFGGDIRWLVSGDINQGVIEDCEGRITQKGLENSNCKVLPPQTVLIALNGQGKTRASVALLKVAAACNQSLVGMIPFDAAILDPLFLLLSLRYRYYEIRDITGQDQRRGLNMGLVAELSIPLPPLVEQHRIVAKVDELMALCDQLEQQQTHSIEAHQVLVETLLGTLTHVALPQELSEAWTRIANHFDTLFTTEYSIDRLKQTILQLAVTGKLVPQDPNDEPASVLLKAIAVEKTLLAEEGKTRKETPRGIAERAPFVLPNGWAWSELADLLAVVTDGDHQAPPQSEEGTPFLVIGNLNTGAINFGGCKFVPPEYYERLDWGRKPVAGDLLYTVTGSFGISVLIDTEREFCVQRHVAILKATRSTPRQYLALVLASRFAIEYATAIATGIAQKTVPLTGLRRMPIPVPPAVEQHRIVARVGELMALCEALKARLADAQTTQINLADAIVEQAVA